MKEEQANTDGGGREVGSTGRVLKAYRNVYISGRNEIVIVNVLVLLHLPLSKANVRDL